MDYIQNLLLDDSIPVAGKTLLLKLYGVTQGHLRTALGGNNDELRIAVYNHVLCDNHFLESVSKDPENVVFLAEMVKHKPGLFKVDNILDFYIKAMEWAQGDPERAKELLVNLHGHSDFGALDEDSVTKIKELATGELGTKLGLNSFFPEPDPVEDKPLIMYRDGNAETVDANGFRVRIVDPNGTNPSSPLSKDDP